MLIPFIKMQSAGNDYVYLDMIKNPVFTTADFSALSKTVSDRHFGIGADGLVLMLPSKTSHVKMKMFNADGSVGKTCGTALRSIATYFFTHNDLYTMRIETDAGDYVATLNNDKSVSVDMKTPTKSGELINAGNLHKVFIVDELSTYPVYERGKAECERLDANIEFVQPVSRNKCLVKTYERGSGLTLCCGSGATAVAYYLVTLGVFPVGERLELVFDGGTLYALVSPDYSVLLTGTAKTVFTGEFDYEP